MKDLNWIDYGALAVVGISVLVAVWRGAIREVFSLAGWFFAIAAVSLWGGNAADCLPSQWSTATRTGVGYAGLFLGVLIGTGVVGWFLSRIVRTAGLGVMDSLLGAVFGLVRGFLMVLVLVAVALHTPLHKASAWERAAFVPFFVDSLDLMKSWFPGGRLPLQF
jgi:membrane protein required for colicin V production